MQSIGQVVGSNPFKRDSNRAVVNGVPGARQSREAARPQAGNPVSRPKNRRPGWGVCFWVCARFLAREFKRASTRRSVSRSAEHEKTFGRPAAESSFCLFVPKRVFTSLRGKRMRL